jgi:two-component system, NarL family, invasion response regulator UvrY
MIRVLIADDHAIIRRGLKQIIAEEPDMVVAGEVERAAQALDLARLCDWDVAILDISLPGRNGLDVLKDMHQEFPKRPILILTMHQEEQFAIRAFKAGATGYLTKESAPEQLILALKKVVSGGRYVSPALAERLASRITDYERLPHEALSDREYQVFHLLTTGKTVSTIAQQLSLSVKTISTYRTRLLEKMQLKNNAELMHYAVTHRLFE